LYLSFKLNLNSE